jgi:hypothetical protein
MNKSFEIKGYWYLPNNPKKKLYGTLKYDPYESINLELIGSFDDISEQIKMPDKDIIFGFTTKKEKVTLCRCLITNLNNGFSEMPGTTYFVNVCIIGNHYPIEEEILIKRISVRMDLFEKWVKIYMHKIEVENIGNLKLISKNIESITFKLDRETKGKFQFVNSHDFLPNQEFKLVQRTFLELESEGEPFSLNHYVKKLLHLRNFLMLAVCDEISVTSFIIASDSNKEMVSGRPIEVFFLQNKPKESLFKKDSRDFMFTYKDIESDFENIINNWFEKSDLRSLTTAVYLFYQNRKSYAENVFLDGTQALEVFHRKLRQDTEKLKKEFNIRLDDICSSLSSSDKKFIKAKLEFGFEPNLRSRLKDLISELNTEIVKVLFNDKDGVKTFVDKVVNTRNYLIHSSESIKNKACSGSDLFYLSKQINYLLIIFLLKEIGFSNEELKHSLDKIKHLITDYFNK